MKSYLHHLLNFHLWNMHLNVTLFCFILFVLFYSCTSTNVITVLNFTVALEHILISGTVHPYFPTHYFPGKTGMLFSRLARRNEAANGTFDTSVKVLVIRSLIPCVTLTDCSRASTCLQLYLVLSISWHQDASRVHMYPPVSSISRISRCREHLNCAYSLGNEECRQSFPHSYLKDRNNDHQ